jgi:hypothetical protein
MAGITLLMMTPVGELLAAERNVKRNAMMGARHCGPNCGLPQYLVSVWETWYEAEVRPPTLEP